MGIRRVYRVEGTCRLTIEGSRIKSRPWGLAGGKPAGGTIVDIGDRRGAPCGTIDLVPGQVVSIVTPGGVGGFGPPSDRPPASIARDAAEGRTMVEHAAAVYGTTEPVQSRRPELF